jgi:hypothetical protein
MNNERAFLFTDFIDMLDTRRIASKHDQLRFRLNKQKNRPLIIARLKVSERASEQERMRSIDERLVSFRSRSSFRERVDMRCKEILRQLIDDPMARWTKSSEANYGRLVRKVSCSSLFQPDVLLFIDQCSVWTISELAVTDVSMDLFPLNDAIIVMT